MNQENLLQKWLEEEQFAFKGWDFSHLDGRWNLGSADIKWDYKSLFQNYLSSTDKLLDMGTGGGEFLLSLGHPYENTAVTEAWEPNIEICLKILAPLGIRVYVVENDATLPILDNCFDIIINRHETYDLREIKRILKPDGFFITQQVGGRNCIDLQAKVKAVSNIDLTFNLTQEIAKAKSLGFQIQYADECFPVLKFFDVGAFVFWAKIIEWSFPDFTVKSQFENLCNLQIEVEEKGYISSLQHRFAFVLQNKK